MDPKKADDIVRLVNTSEKDCVFKFDSNDYKIGRGSAILLKRHIANHGARKCFSRSELGDVIYSLSVEEIENKRLVNGQVSIDESAEIEKLRAENEYLRSQQQYPQTANDEPANLLEEQEVIPEIAESQRKPKYAKRSHR